MITEMSIAEFTRGVSENVGGAVNKVWIDYFFGQSLWWLT